MGIVGLFTVGFNIFVEFGGGVVLGIAAEDFYLLFGNVGKVDEVADHVPEAGLIKESLNEAMEGINSIGFDGFVAGNFAPGVEVFVGGKEGTHAGIYAIADNAKGVIFHQFGDVAGVAGGELLVGVKEGGFGAGGAFEFKDNQG